MGGTVLERNLIIVTAIIYIVITYAVAQLVLSELSPCDLDGNSS